MKNIHVLPTDKPSSLYLGNNGNFVFGMIQTSIQSRNDDFTNQHLYITSDEKFNRDEYVTDGVEVIKATPKLVDAQSLVDRRDWKKIILTTDGDLIKDGVQAIDDEFLEWFVNNPSCESVEVRKECCGQCDERLCEVYDRGIGWNKNNTFYEIIIPKEEPKQDMKQTAVEWLYNHLFPKQLDGFSDEEWNKIDLAFNQAKEMEKQQIVDAWIADNNELQRIAAEQYYNETFKNK